MPDAQKCAAVDNEGAFSHSSHDVRLQRIFTITPLMAVLLFSSASDPVFWRKSPSNMQTPILIGS
ncbi:hypothetical protein [Methanoregula sp.]|jgi:hypothetical protein|uniref:hypothetical protein n=1 Tax=Methanoregula sp. TaxID=2052170 RepID=UPI003C772952